MNTDKTLLEKYYILKQKNFADIEHYMIKISREEQETIYCKRKCYYCCTGYLIGPEIEIELIYYFLEKSDFLQKRFILNYKRWEKKTKKISYLIKKINKLIQNLEQTADRKEYLRLSGEFAENKILCPFLYKKECLIYPVRPYVCANRCSFTIPAKCKKMMPDRKILVSDIPPVIPFQKNRKTLFKPIIYSLWTLANLEYNSNTD